MGKRDAWRHDFLYGVGGKRAWNSGFTGGMGKRGVWIFKQPGLLYRLGIGESLLVDTTITF